MENQTISNEAHRGILYPGESFSECVFDNCQFIETRLCNVHFFACSFKNCNLSLVNLENTCLHNVTFLRCKIVGGNFHLSEKKLFSIRIEESFLLHCNFSGLKMKKTSFKGSKIKECDFKETLLEEADFSSCNLEGSLFHNCNLRKADFRGALNYAIDPRTNQIEKGKFSIPEALILLKAFDITLD